MAPIDTAVAADRLRACGRSGRLCEPLSEAAMLFPAFLLALVLIFAPILIYVYDYHDSLQFFFSATQNPRCGYAGPFFKVFTAGRPLFSFFYCLTVPHLMSGVETAALVRAEGLLVMAIAATMLFYFLRMCGLARAWAAAAALLCFLLPGPQEFVYTSHGTPIMWAFPFAIGSAIALFETMAAAFAGRWVLAVLCAIGSLALLLICGLTYQTISEIFLAILFVRLITMQQESMRRRLAYLVIGGLLFAAHLIAYMAIHRLIVMPFALMLGSSEEVAQTARVILAPTLSADAFWLFGERIARGGTLWFFGTGAWMAALLAGIVGLFCVIVARNGRAAFAAAGSLGNLLLYPLGLLVLFVLLTNALPLVKPDPERLALLFRTMIAFQWILVFFAVYIASQAATLATSKGQRLAIVATCLIAGVGAAGFVTWNLYYNFVRLNAAEFAYVKRELVTNRSHIDGSNICMIQPRPEPLGSLRSFFALDEFGSTSATFYFDVPLLVVAAAEAAGVNVDKRGGIYAFHENAKPNGLVCGVPIDMRWLDRY